MNGNLSDKQNKIKDTWLNTTFNIIINAVAGSGKTTMLLELVKECVYKTLIVSFNNSIQQEFQEKLEKNNLPQGKAQTLHSLGLASIRKKYRVSIDKNKNYDLIKSLQSIHKDIFRPMKWEDKLKLTYTLIDMNDVSRLFLTNNFNDIVKYMSSMDKTYFSVKEIRYLWDELVKLRNESYEGSKITIDFHDMIYLPILKNLYIPSNPYYLMVDEAQDLNFAQHTLIDQLISQGDVKRWIAVGDRNQCQPKGTKILMKDLSEKNIEDLVIGDEVVSYDINKCQFVGTGKAWNVKTMKVLDTKISNRVDNLFTFNLDSGHKSSYTSNHRCYVQLSEEKMRDKYVVYMMRKGKNFRLGISPCFSKFKSNAFAPVMRARAEKAEDLWILRTFETRKEAFLHEQILSYKFKIPQTRFIDNTNSVQGLNQKQLDVFWHEFKNQEANASYLLREFRREIEYPLWSNTNNSQGGIGNSWKLSSKAMFKTQACNILPDIMSMCIFNKNNTDKKGRILKNIVGISDYSVSLECQEFISLDVEKNHNYVADGILTSNSIYGFSGAHSSSFDLFKSKGNVVELPLDICYRCPTEIIKSANQVYDVMLPFKSSKGKVKKVLDPLDIKSKSLVICRNSSPLLDLYFVLLGEGRKVFIKGEDIMSGIMKFLKPHNYKTVSKAHIDISTELNNLFNKKDDSDSDSIKYYLYKENYKNFTLLSRNLGNTSQKVEDLIQKFKLLFKDKEGAITLCTIHKSKGLEADIVYILNESLIPSKFAKSEQQRKQEKNLKYVARTRAKEELYFLEI